MSKPCTLTPAGGNYFMFRYAPSSKREICNLSEREDGFWMEASWRVASSFLTLETLYQVDDQRPILLGGGINNIISELENHDSLFYFRPLTEAHVDWRP